MLDIVSSARTCQPAVRIMSLGVMHVEKGSTVTCLMGSALAGLQLRNSEQNFFHDYYLISQPNPMMWPSLKSSLRDDSNEWLHHRVRLRNKKVSILKTINFRPYLLSWHCIACRCYICRMLIDRLCWRVSLSYVREPFSVTAFLMDLLTGVGQ